MNTQINRFDWHLRIAFSVLFVLLLGNAFLANQAVVGLTEGQKWVAHSWEVRSTLGSAQIQFEKSISAGRGYFLLDEPAYLTSWANAQRAMHRDFDRLDTLVADNPTQQKIAARIRTLTEGQSRFVAESMQIKKQLGPRWKPNKERVNISKTFIDSISLGLVEMESEERRISGRRSQQSNINERQTRLAIFGATATACVALVATFVLMRRTLQERLRGEREAREANAELERRVVERTESLQSANERLNTANQELEAFSYTVSHDLRAPLRHVVGFADLLDKKSGPLLDEPGRRYLTLIKDAGRRAGQLIDDLLAFSRMSRTELGYGRVNMQEKVERISGELGVENPGQEIRWEIAPLPEVWGDAAMLRLVWRNLLENAIKYSGKEPVSRIQVGVRQTPSEWEFFVKDNGVGFDMAHIDKLFGVFQRLHDFEAFEGTGIGLASVRRIVTRHGGRTWAESVTGEGATFFFSLPTRPEETQESPS